MKKLTAIVLLSVVAVSGCSESEPSESEPIPTMQDLAEITAEIWAQTETLTRECMSQQGFEYIERPVPERLHSPSGDPTQGVFDFPLLSEDPPEDGLGISSAATQSSEGEEADPNDAIQEELGAQDDDNAELDAWLLALLGDSVTFEGCRGESRVQSESQVLSEGKGLIVQELTSVAETIQIAPELDEIWTEWSNCLAGEGTFATDYDDLVASLTTEYQSFTGEDGSEAAVEEFRTKELEVAGLAHRCFEPHREIYRQIVQDLWADASEA